MIRKVSGTFMKRKIIGLVLAFSMAMAASGCSSKEDQKTTESTEAVITEAETTTEVQENNETLEGNVTELPYGGVTFEYPDSMVNATAVFFAGGGMEISDIKGVYYSVLYYCGMDINKYMELYNKDTLTEEEGRFFEERVFPLAEVYGIDGGRSLNDLADLLSEYGYTAEQFKELGSVGEYNFFYTVNPEEERVNNEIVFDEGFREEFESVFIPAFDDVSWIKISEPKPVEAVSGVSEGAFISFETKDLDGNTVKSEDIFSKNKITVVNIWGTYCGPCINEMPDLEVLSKNIADKQCGFIGVVIDISGPDDKGQIDAAKEIISDTGVTYLNLVPWGGIDSQLPTEFIPTTYFIDSNGNVVGEAVVGAHTAEEYESLIDEALEKTK
jgi:Redoxin.